MGGNGVEPRSRLSLLIHSVMKIDIYQLCPMRHIGFVEFIKPAHQHSPPVLVFEAASCESLGKSVDLIRLFSSYHLSSVFLF